MPVELTIVESVTELDTTVVEVTLESASTPGPAGPGVPAGGTLNQVLTKDSGTDYDTSWQDAQGAGGGAPDDATYLVTAAHGDLTAEVVVGATPGGELGGTWASPTVDATHSGSSHAAVQAAAEATAASALASHAGAADPHTGYRLESVTITAADVAADVATQAELDAHIDDATDAHDASAVSVDSTSLSGTATHVQGSLEELDNLLDDHSSRHENGGADELNIGGLDGTPAELTNHLNDSADAHDASAISFTPAGSIAATDVQAAIEEVASEAGGGGLTFAGARVFHNADQALTTGAVTALALNSERYDTDTFHDTATNNSRLTVPTGMGGKYLIGGHVDFAANATGARQVSIRVNGSTTVAIQTMPVSSAAINSRMSITAEYDLAAGDYVELIAFQNSGGNLNVVAAGNFSPEFWIDRRS